MMTTTMMLDDNGDDDGEEDDDDDGDGDGDEWWMMMIQFDLIWFMIQILHINKMTHDQNDNMINDRLGLVLGQWAFVSFV